MCGRYALYEKKKEIEQFLNAVSEMEDFVPNYNVAPTHEMPVAYVNEEGKRVMERLHWGFMGWKAKPGARPFYPINTRSDSLPAKPMWKNALSVKRCIIPANGFYEWTGSKSNKTPHFIHPKNGGLWGFAGIYSELAPEGKAATKSYSIITTEANKVMENIHERMPAILHPEEFDDWLNPHHQDSEYLAEFLKPYPEDAMQEYIVSNACGNVRNNDPTLIQKAELF